MNLWLRRGILVFLALATVPAHPNAQGSATPAVTVTPNVNVLRNVSDPLLGDANLQRQTEPVVAVSTRNPEHIMVAFSTSAIPTGGRDRDQPTDPACLRVPPIRAASALCSAAHIWGTTSTSPLPPTLC